MYVYLGNIFDHIQAEETEGDLEMILSVEAAASARSVASSVAAAAAPEEKTYSQMEITYGMGM